MSCATFAWNRDARGERLFQEQPQRAMYVCYYTFSRLGFMAH